MYSVGKSPFRVYNQAHNMFIETSTKIFCEVPENPNVC